MRSRPVPRNNRGRESVRGRGRLIAKEILRDSSATGWLYNPGSVPLAIGTPTMLPHSVQEPS